MVEDMAGEPSLAEQGYVKVRMSDEDGFTETAWAVRVASGKDHFRLDNSPFYAYGVSYEDVIEGRLVVEGMYEFVRVVERSGNRTVRLMFGDERADSAFGKGVIAELHDLGCSVENMFDITMSITVPTGVRLDEVAAYLTSTGLDWEYADPTYSDQFGES
jgi:hypothetical protein